MIIHYNCTRKFLVALVFADLPSLSPFISILVPLIFLLVVAKPGRTKNANTGIHYTRMRKIANIYAACALAQTAPRPAE